MSLKFGKKRIAAMPVNPQQLQSSPSTHLSSSAYNNIPAKTNCVDIRSELTLLKRLMK